MSAQFSQILVQVSFPAAVQIIALFIPILYVVLRQNARLEEEVLEDHRGLELLLLAVALCELLYLASVSLLVAQSGLTDHFGSFDTLAWLSGLVLFLLVLIAVLPIVFCFDVLASSTQGPAELPLPSNQQKFDGLKAACLVAHLDETPEEAKQVLVGKLGAYKLACGDTTLEYRSFARYCEDHKLPLLLLGLHALRRYTDSRQDKASLLADGLWRLRRYKRFRSKYRAAWGKDERTQRLAFEALAAVAIMRAITDLRSSTRRNARPLDDFDADAPERVALGPLWADGEDRDD